MVKTKKERLFLALGAIGLSFLFVGIIFAQTVPQKIGFMDVKFVDLNKELCSECHESSMVDTHHSTDYAVSGDCVRCHSVSTQPGSMGVSLQRDCMTCHEKSPHHATETAENKECTSCHDSLGVSDYSMEVPSYEISKITPKPSDCRNCHDEGIVDGQRVLNPKDTHHEISTCGICHDQLVLSADEESDDKGVTIRTCERCHNVKALHEVAPHVEKQNCIVCHGGKTVAVQPAVEEEGLKEEKTEEEIDQ